ncbi:MAG: hypothetical protein ACXVA9_10515 [Bdellovibrionales bacterium]
MKFPLILFALILPFTVMAAETSLPGTDSSNVIGEVYRDMIVVQRKAKDKAGSALFAIFDANEFSDGPEAINLLNFSLGYAFTDSFEGYANVAPIFFTQDRQIKKSVSSLKLEDGQQAALVTPSPKLQYGVDLLWLPAYGKDSWGPHTIVRSDTFFKLSASMVQFTVGSGWRATLGIGKSFFLSRWFNPRVSAAFGFHESIVNGVKATSQLGLIELGTVWYL